MTVTDPAPTATDQHDAGTGGTAMQSDACAELAQELTLVARAMFAQLLPDAGSYALTGLAQASARPDVHAATGPTAASASRQLGPVDLPDAYVDAARDGLAVPATHPVAAAGSTRGEAPELQAPAGLTAVPVPEVADVTNPAAASVPPVEVPSASLPQLEVPGLEPAGALPPVDVAPPDPAGSLALEVPTLDVPSLAAPQIDDHAGTHAPPTAHPAETAKAPLRTERSLAMLAEIGFLDE